MTNTVSPICTYTTTMDLERNHVSHPQKRRSHYESCRESSYLWTAASEGVHIAPFVMSVGWFAHRFVSDYDVPNPTSKYIDRW
jgi:hypothetical protein